MSAPPPSSVLSNEPGKICAPIRLAVQPTCVNYAMVAPVPALLTACASLCFVAITPLWHRPAYAMQSVPSLFLLPLLSPSPSCHCHCEHHHQGATQRRMQPAKGQHFDAGGPGGAGIPFGAMWKGSRDDCLGSLGWRWASSREHCTC